MHSRKNGRIPDLRSRGTSGGEIWKKTLPELEIYYDQSELCEDRMSVPGRTTKELYEMTYRTVKDIDPQLQFGGAGFFRT